MNTAIASSLASQSPIAILGIPFDGVTTAEAIARIEQMIASRKPHYLVTANVDFLVQALDDVELRRILVDADMVLCDGTPLLWVSRLLGNALPERVAGSDLVPILIKAAAQKGHRIFFLGGDPETAERAAARITADNPGLQVAGYYSPPYRRLLEMDHDEIQRRIQEAQPDLLFVSFGCPKQEKWIAMHYQALGVPVAIGVGGTIDFLAGRTIRAPRWMQQAGLEWIFRLAQEPRRLFRRYASDLWQFSGAILRQWWQLRLSRARALPRQAPAADARRRPWKLVRLSDRLDVQTARQNAMLCDQALSVSRQCVLDLSRIQFVDSTGVGLLIRLHKRARISGRKLILLAPSPAVIASFRLMRLEDFFVLAPNLARAREMLRSEAKQTPVECHPNYFSSRPAIKWKGEIIAANAAEVWKSMSEFLGGPDRGATPVIVDLSGVRFIDTTGVGLMLRVRKHAEELGRKLRFTAAPPNVLNVLRKAGLESLAPGGRE